MRRHLAITAAALASLWAGAAWSATGSGPSDDGTSLTFAPADSAVVSPAGILDPAFRSGTFAAVLAEPPASTIAFHFSDGGISGAGLVERNFAPDMNASPLDEQSGLSLRDIIVSAALTPDADLTFAQGRDLAAIGAFGGGDSPYNSLFLSAAGMRSPYLSVTDGGLYAGVTLHLADTLQLRIGHAALGGDAAARQSLLANPGLNALPHDLALQLAGDGRSAGTTAAGLDWNFADWGMLGVTASHSSETGSLLGGTPIAVADAAETAALGISARVGFGAGWVTTVSYSEGITQLDLRASTFIPAPSTFKSRAYGISVAKQGLFGDDDTIGLSLSRPLQMVDANPGLLGGTGLTGGNFGFGTGGLLGGAPESDIEFGYVTSFLGGALALQTNAAYQVNAGGQKGQGAVAVVSRAKINF